MESFRLKNVKGFIDSGDISLRPLTFIIGQNSSGKSSIMRFPLVLKQTFLDDSMAPLLFYGKSIDYGNFEDVVFEHKKDGYIEFELIVKYDHLRRFSPIFRHRWAQLSNSKYLKIRVNIFQDDYGTLQIKELYIDNLENGLLFSLTLSEDKLSYEITGLGSKKRIFKVKDLIFDKFIPDFRISQFRRNLKEDEQSSDLYYFLIDLSRYFSFVVNNIFYIGPFRKTPERSYRYKENAVNYVGLDGEFAPVILGQDRKKGGQLISQVSDWLSQYLKHRIDIENLVGSEYRGTTDLFRLVVTDEVTGQKNNLIDVGHGLSQLIPIIVQTFLHQPKSPQERRNLPKINIIEQPELHLHPAAQACLVDLFIEGINGNRYSANKFLIETHSEHLLIRLRRYIIEGKISPKDIAIYYSEKVVNKNYNILRELKVDEYGNIAEWPEGFFEEDYNEVLKLRESLQKKQKGNNMPW